MKKFVTGRLKAFRYVFRGMGWMLRHEASLQVQVFLLFLSALLSYYLKFDRTDWIFFIVLWGLILTAETLNTAIEKLADDWRTWSCPVMTNEYATSKILPRAVWDGLPLPPPQDIFY